MIRTVDGCEILHQLKTVVYPINRASTCFNHPFGGPRCLEQFGLGCCRFPVLMVYQLPDQADDHETWQENPPVIFCNLKWG